LEVSEWSKKGEISIVTRAVSHSGRGREREYQEIVSLSLSRVVQMQFQVRIKRLASPKWDLARPSNQHEHPSKTCR
jgi:hypothetical protein